MTDAVFQLTVSIVQWTREIRLLAAASFTIATGYGLAAPALPVLAVAMGVGATGVAVLVGSFAAARIAAAPVGGRLLGKGPVRLFRLGLAIVAVSSAACAVAADYGQLLVFRTIGGVGSTMFTVSAAALVIAAVPPSRRARAFGVWSGAFLLGTMTGPVIGAVLLAIGPRVPFVGYALMLGVVVVATGRWGSTPSQSPVVRPGAGTGFLTALRHPAFRAALVANVVNGWTVYGVRIALVPLLVLDLSGGSEVWVGVVLAAFAVGTVLTLPLGGRLADRVGRRPAAMLGSAVVALTALSTSSAGSPAALAVVAVLSGAGTGLLTPGVSAAVGDLGAGDDGEPAEGSALAGFQMVGDAGAVVGPVTAGLLVQTSGLATAFAVTALVAGVSFVAWLVAPETSPATGR